MHRRIESGVVVLGGLALIAVALIAQLFTRAPAFERLTDEFRPAMTASAIDTMGSDLSMMQGIGTEMQADVMPAFAQTFGMTPEDFSAYAEANFPAFSAGMQQMPGITESFMGFASSLDAQRANFEAADAIPTKSLPATLLPWGFLVAGLIALAAGVLMLKLRAGAYIALVLGVMLVVAPLLMSWISKASKADDLNIGLRPLMTTEQVVASEGALALMGDMAAEMNTSMLPAIAGQLGMSVPDLQAYMGENFPATGEAMASMDGALARFDGMVATMSANIDDYNTIKPLKLEPLVWILLAVGLIVGTTGFLALFFPVPEGSVKRHIIPAH